MADTQTLPDIQTVREKRPGRRPLSGDQLEDALSQVKNALYERKAAMGNVGQLKEELKEAKEHLENIEESIIKLNEHMTRGEEHNIDVDVTYDYSNGWVTVFDVQTGGILEEREMTEEDRQSNLDLEDDDDVEEETTTEVGVSRIELDEDDPGDEYPDRSSDHFTGASE